MRICYCQQLAAFLSVIMLAAWEARGQAPIPSTDIYLTPIYPIDYSLKLSAVRNLTNRPGYDNQPSFLPDGKSLLYTSVRADGQADIFQYRFADNTITQLTHTEESEYSPTIMPEGRHFSVVRVEKDSTQRLWKFPLASGAPSVVLEQVKPVGYHAWVDTNTVVLFVLGEPNTLQLANVRTGKSEAIQENIGRSLHKIPKREAISFVHKISESEWTVKQCDLKSREVSVIIPTLPGSEDYAWMPNGALLMAKGTQVFYCSPERSRNWQMIADFVPNLVDEGVDNITRLAVSPDGNWLALVASDAVVK